MHGVGGEPVQRAFRVFNLPELIPVLKQMEPDPEFPTVTFPNPEEGKSALVRQCSQGDGMPSWIGLQYTRVQVWYFFA